MILLLPLLTPFLTKYDFGVWGLILTYTGLLSGIKDIGLTQLIVNAFFQRRKYYHTIWRIYFGWLLVWSLIFVLIQALILWFSLGYLTLNERISIIGIFSFISLIVDPYVLFIFRFCQLKNDFSPIAVNSLLAGLFSIILSYYLIAVMKLGYWGWIWSLFAGQLVSFLHYYMVSSLKRIKLSPIFAYRPFLMSEAARIGLPTIPHNYSAYILNASDRIVMDKVKVPINDIGLYSLGYSVGIASDAIGSAVTMTLSPVYLRLFSEKKMNIVKDITKHLQYVFLFLSLLVGIWIKEIFFFLVKNPTLLDAYKVTFIVLLSYAFRPLYVVPINILGYFGKTSSLWKITFTGALINIILNLIFIPLYGYFVAAITTFISYLFIGVAGYFLKQFKEVCQEHFKITFWVLFISLLTTTGFFILELSYMVKAGSSIFLLIFSILNISKLEALNQKYRLF